ncbi:hypothetical protein ACJ41O_010128 [Fusarium nematophilum]
MPNLVFQDRLQKERGRFIDAIDESAIRQLASSYHNGDECHFFQPYTHGRFIVSYFVRFSDGDSWVVRVPISPCLSFDAQQQIEREVATMQLSSRFCSRCGDIGPNLWALCRLVSQRTAIPTPRVIAHSLDGSSFGVRSFVVVEYVQGKLLSGIRVSGLAPEKRAALYQGLGDVYAQLRRLGFAKIGALGFTADGDIEVTQGPVSVEFNTLELEGVQPSRACEFRGPQGSLSSASQYVSALLDMARNTFVNSPVVTQDEADGAQTLYYIDQFDRFVRDEWLDSSSDHGPFVMSHGNLIDRNLMVDGEMRIVAVLGWEWSRIVPLQLFNPPLWLVSKSPELLASRQFYERHVEELEKFRAVLCQRERALFGNTILSCEWANVERGGGVLAAAALESMDLEAIFYFGFRYRDDFQVPSERVDEFMARDPARSELVAKKVRDGQAYDRQCQRLRLGEYSVGVKLE